MRSELINEINELERVQVRGLNVLAWHSTTQAASQSAQDLASQPGWHTRQGERGGPRGGKGSGKVAAVLWDE